MNEVTSIGFALDPTNVPTFLLDWELTKLCNLDCTYCSTGINGGHDNSTKHPILKDCLTAIDFMYEYVNLYMQYKKNTQRKVILNVYGGESLFHPDIVEILENCKKKYQKYKNNWHLTITCTTNGIVGKNQWKKIVPFIDEFTMSYHSENLHKQKQQFKSNLLYLTNQKKPFKCAIIMHNQKNLFDDCKQFAQFCQENNYNYVLKPLENHDEEHYYSPQQFNTLKTFWINSVPNGQKNKYTKIMDTIDTNTSVSSIQQGRPCCGGRKLSINNDLKSCVTYVPKQGFKDWYCSVNWFFLFVRQLDKAVFTNKDCKMSTTGKVEPLGFLDDYESIIKTLKLQLESGSMPTIQCKKDICVCGFCAPKASTKEKFINLINRSLIPNFQLK